MSRPHGKPNDRYAVDSTSDGLVQVQLRKPSGRTLTLVSLLPDQADALADALRVKAEEARGVTRG